MGYQLRRWLADRLPDTLSSGERLVALEIADLANDQTRRAFGHEIRATLLRRTGYANEKQLGKVLTKLARRGLEFRVPVMGKDGQPTRDKRGRVMYACHGHEVSEFMVPRLDDLPSCPERGSIADDAAPPGSGSCPERGTLTDEAAPLGASSSPGGGSIADEAAPPGSGSCPAGGSMVPPEGHPSPQSPHDPSSLSAPERRIMATTGATADEAREMITIIKTENRPRSLGGYVATLAANGDLAAILDRVRSGSRAAPSSTPVPPSYAELLARTPCPHGTPGGDQPHPRTGAPSCPLCRAGGVPEPKAGPRPEQAASSRDLTDLRAALDGIRTRISPERTRPPGVPVGARREPVRTGHPRFGAEGAA